MPVSIIQRQQAAPKKDLLDYLAQGIGAVGGLYDISKKSKENDILSKNQQQAQNQMDAQAQLQKEMTQPGNAAAAVSAKDYTNTWGEPPPPEANTALAIKQLSDTRAAYLNSQKEKAGIANVQATTGKTNLETSTLIPSQAKENDSKTAKNYFDISATKKDNKALTDLRKEYSDIPVTKATQTVAASYNKMLKSAEKPSPATDMALVYNFMRMNDPGSTVRESEFAAAQGLGGTAQQLQSLYLKAAGGQMLTDKQRQDMVSASQNLYAGQIEQQKLVDKQYSSIASRYGIDPQYVLQPFGVDEASIKSSTDKIAQNTKFNQENKPQGLKELLFGKTPANANSGGLRIGTIEDGHKYIGGKPNDPKSWEKVK